MKTKLFITALFTSAITFAQSPIQHFFRAEATPLYIFGMSATPLNQTASGANQTYNFDTLIDAGTSEATCVPVNSAQTTTYPGSTHVQANLTNVTGQNLGNSIFLKNSNETLSITGFSTNDMTLNYNTNNGLIGTFPLNYGYTNSDAVAGSFSGMGYNGTFNGTMISTVDAYGTLTVNIGNITAGTPITRLKIVQNINLNYIIPNVGTVTQVSYLYYSTDQPYFPIFRTTDTSITVPAMNVDESYGTIEIYQTTLLSTQENTLSSDVKIFPNPTKDILNINGIDDNVQIIIYDLNGRKLSESRGNSINTANLNSGIYVLEIKSENKTTTRKFVKE